MNNHDLKKLAALTCVASTTLSSALSGLCAIVNAEPLHTITLYGACGSGAVAALSAMGWGVSHWLAGLRTAVYGVRPVLKGELPLLLDIAKHFFGESVTALDKVTEWAGRRKDVFHFVYARRAKGLRQVEQIEGYVCALALTKKAAADILSQRRHVNDLGHEDLVAPGVAPAAVYIGACAAKSDICQSIALQHTIGLVRRLTKSRGDTMIITRPVSKQGMHLVTSFGLMPVGGHSEGGMFKLHSARLNQLLIINRTQAGAH